jgi:predicted nucleotidyltransferase
MRLTEKTVNQILQVSKEQLAFPFELRLYGSRLEDDARGGDIDLLLIVDKDSLSEVKSRKHQLLAKLKTTIGDQKIDLSICSAEDIEENPFLKHVYPLSKHLGNSI